MGYLSIRERYQVASTKSTHGSEKLTLRYKTWKERNLHLFSLSDGSLSHADWFKLKFRRK